jgi:hypothetical protein
LLIALSYGLRTLLTAGIVLLSLALASIFHRNAEN